MSATAELSIAGMEPTGRRLKGPASELIELKDPNDDDALLHTAIVYEDQYQGHPALTENVRLALNFMEAPMVAGLIDLSHHDLDAGWYVYPTGATRTIQEVLKAYRDIGQAPGLRAALEMCYLAGMAIVEAGESGPTQGVFSHGDVSPSRVLITTDGQVQVIGHAIPQIEVIEWRGNNDHVVREESFRYCPPERIEGTMEDPTSDLYCLTLMAYEMITGKDLFQGSLDAIIKAARTAEGPNLLAKAAKAKGKKAVKLPAAVREWMEMALQFDPSVRLQGHDYINALYELLSDEKVEGDTLFDIAKRVFGTQRKGRALQSAGTTEAIPRRALQAASSNLGIRAPGGRFVAGGRRRDGDGEGEDGEENRWGSVSRGPARRGAEEEDEGGGRRRRRRRRGDDEPEEEAEEAGTSRRRRRRRKGDDEEEPKAEEAGTSRRRRRRRKGDDEEPEEDDTKAEEAEDDKPARRRRRRRGGDDDDADEAEKAEAPKEEEKPARRRRRRGSASDDDASDEPEAKEEPKAEEKPARRRRRRGSASDDDAGDEPEAKEEPKAEEKPARRRRRRGSASDDDTGDEPEAKEEAKAEEKPARRRRRRSSASDDDAGDEAKTDDKAEAEEDDKPKRRRRRRTPKK